VVIVISHQAGSNGCGNQAGGHRQSLPSRSGELKVSDGLQGGQSLAQCHLRPYLDETHQVPDVPLKNKLSESAEERTHTVGQRDLISILTPL
jgi:hypothetical protein